METFYDENADDYVNNYNTFPGVVMNRISVSDTNYESKSSKIDRINLEGYEKW